MGLMHGQYLERKLHLQPCLLSSCKRFKINKAIFMSQVLVEIAKLYNKSYLLRFRLLQTQNCPLMIMFGVKKQEERVKSDILAQLFWQSHNAASE